MKTLEVDESKSLIDYFREDVKAMEENFKDNKSLGAYIVIAIGPGTAQEPNYHVRLFNEIDQQSVAGVLSILELQWKLRILTKLSERQNSESKTNHDITLTPSPSTTKH